MPKGGSQYIGGLMEGDEPGVVRGLIVRDPGSATLTATIEGGVINVASPTFNRVTDQYVIASTTNAFTASKDTYVYVTAAGVLSYLALANNAAPPTQATLGAGSIRIAKVVTDGTRVVAGGVTDMRSFAPTGFPFQLHTWAGYYTAALGAIYLPVPFNGVIRRVDSTVVTALAGTDAGTATLAIGVNDVYTDVTNGVISHAASAALGNRIQVFPSAANVILRDQTLRITTAKTTATGAGASIISITIEGRP